MDDVLQRLLEAERRAEEIARQASQDKEHRIEQALADARQEDAQFEARLPELRQAFVQKAQQRAEQTIGELRKRHDERHSQVRQLADQNEATALRAAFQLLTDPSR
jgi:vacuolar-type H+-ATPase subunit H